MAALSALVFSLSWWLGLYLLARDPRKPVLVLAAVGLTSFAVVVALDAVRVVSGLHLLSSIEVYLGVVPGIAWFAVLLELSRPSDTWRSRAGEIALIAAVAALAFFGAAMAGNVDGPVRLGHWVMFAAISLSSLGAMLRAVFGPWQPRPVVGYVVVATLFFALGNAILVIPLGLVPSWLALASTGFDVVLLGVAVAMWDAFDEGQALRGDMLRSFVATGVVVVLFGGQALIGMAVTGERTALTVLLFTSIAIAVSINVLADPLAGILDRLAFSRSPGLRADRATLRRAESALPLRSASPLANIDDEAFARLTRRALGHYGDLSKLVASPLTALPTIDERLAARGAPDQPLERANELKALLADRIARLKPRDGGDFGTTEQWRHYNALYFPYVVGVRAYAQNATAAGPRSGRAPGLAVVGHRGAAAVAAQLAERRRPADRGGSARQPGRRAKTDKTSLVSAAVGSSWQRLASIWQWLLRSISVMTAHHHPARPGAPFQCRRRCGSGQFAVALCATCRRHLVRGARSSSSPWPPTHCRGCPVCPPRPNGSRARRSSATAWRSTPPRVYRMSGASVSACSSATSRSPSSSPSS